MKRVIDQEIRLAYHDRILSTLPDQFADVDGIISPEPLEEDYKFRSSCKRAVSFRPRFRKRAHALLPFPAVPHAANAQELLDMVRRRDHAEDVLDRLRQMAETTAEQPIPPEFCEVATHVLLELGKGAFAHHLRVLERYLPVFKALALTSEDRQQLLASSVDYWKHNIQQQVIVFGKYHFYQILDASDIVTFVFSRLVPTESEVSAGKETAWTTAHAWDLINVALEQQYGFAIGSRRKNAKLEREDEEARARRKEMESENVDVDGMVVGKFRKAPQPHPVDDNLEPSN
jgi:nuclear cap-binding protein subunit 1